MKKYYIEISLTNVDYDDGYPYIIQSRWFENKEDAISWAKSIDFMDKFHCIASLMSAIFDNSEDILEYDDIEFEEDVTSFVGVR